MSSTVQHVLFLDSQAPQIILRCANHLLEGQFLQVFSILFPATEARCVESLMVVGTPIVFSHDAVPWVPPDGFEPTPLRRRGSRRVTTTPWRLCEVVAIRQITRSGRSSENPLSEQEEKGMSYSSLSHLAFDGHKDQGLEDS
ncbi:hypothetical protein HRG_014680 [Hirsutella rhossiliensis]